MRSSARYDTTVSSELTLANKMIEYSITTKEESDTSCSLSDEEKESIQIIFDSLVENYSGATTKFDQFLTTMQSMVADEIDFSNDCNLQYFEDLIAEATGT